MEYRKLDLRLRCDLALFERFYEEVFKLAFPNEDEAESLDGFVDQYYRMCLTESNCTMVVYIVLDNGNPIGGLIADLYEESRSALIEYEVIKRDYQGKHIGESLFQYATDDMYESFFKSWEDTLELVFWETEDYDYCLYSGNPDVHENRWRFFSRLGAKKICMNHIQPALEEDKNDISYLELCLWRYIESDDEELSKSKILNFLRDYYKYSIACNNEHKQRVYDKVYESLPDAVSLRRVYV